jgi:hypothetical protein
MRVRAFGITAVTVGTLVIAGCGVKTTPGAAGDPTRTPIPTECVTPKLTQPGKTFTITEKDNGKTYCIVAGTSMFVFLHGTPSRMWLPINLSSAVLTPRPSGIFTLARGVRGAYYLAARIGTVTLTSSRLPCRSAAAAGSTACAPANLFRVTILIRGRM